MSGLAARVRGELNAARKAQAKDRVLLLGTVLSEIKNREIELKRDLTDEDVVEVIRKAIKRRRESVELYEQAGRQELAAVERAEAQALEVWLPAAPSDAEVRAAVKEAIAGGASAIGAVMGKVMPRFKGRLDGSVINRIAREELGTTP
ncbi:MAG: GatB/YqeY domain-containing protein [Gemmatimonadota bacterium]|nr:GatB/YqeY domain-containing protein [Gemmatimonadota bacterium]